MGNRKKSRMERFIGKKRKDEVAPVGPVSMHFSEKGAAKLPLSIKEHEIVKEVPALIHWDNLPDYGREDVETIGKCLIYDDGSQDVVIFDNISEDAKEVVYGLKSQLNKLSIASE